MRFCVYFSLVINLSCTTLLKQLNVCSVCSDSRDGSTKLTTRRSAHDQFYVALRRRADRRGRLYDYIRSYGRYLLDS